MKTLLYTCLKRSHMALFLVFWSFCPSIFLPRFVLVATYPSEGGRRETHGCVFQGRKMCGVTTNIYLRKTLEKPNMGLRTLSIKGSRVVFTHGKGVSTPHVRHKRQQPLIKSAKLWLQFYFISPFLCFFFIFWGLQKRGFCSNIFFNCDEEIWPT